MRDLTFFFVLGLGSLMCILYLQHFSIQTSHLASVPDGRHAGLVSPVRRSLRASRWCYHRPHATRLVF